MTAIALGSLVGLVLGLTGAGGSIFAVPLLVMGLGLDLQQATPITLLAVFGRMEQMMRCDACPRSEPLQLLNHLLDRTASSHTDACEYFAEGSEWPLRQNGEPCYADSADGIGIRDHQHFLAHAFVALRVAFNVECCRRPAGAIVPVIAVIIAIVVIGATVGIVRSGVIAVVIARIRVFTCA